MIKDFLTYKFRHNIFLEHILNKLKKIYALDRINLNELKNNLFIEQFHYAYNNSRFYREFYNSAGVDPSEIKSLDDIQKLPILEKGDIKERINELLIGSKFFVLKGYTSGTSGSPLTVYRDYKSILTENAYMHYFRIRKGLNQRDRVVNLRASLLKGQLKHYDKFANSLNLSGYDINSSNVDYYYNEISKFSPKAIIGYPSSIHALAVEFEKKNYKINIPLGFTSSENVYPHQANKVEEIFNMSFHDWYGNSERTIALEQCGNHYHEAPLYSINEFKKDCVISTSLINKHFPLIRYKVEDQLQLSQSPVTCEISTQMFSSIDGRSSDYLQLKDGSIVNRLNQVFKSIKNINYAQIIQDNVDEVTVNVVVNDKYSLENETDIIRCLTLRTGDQIKIAIRKIKEEELIKTTSGKFRLVINKIANDIV